MGNSRQPREGLRHPFSQCRGSEVGRTLAGATRVSLRRLTPVDAGSPLPRVGPLRERTSVPGTGLPGTHPRDGCGAAFRETLVTPGVVAERLPIGYNWPFDRNAILSQTLSQPSDQRLLRRPMGPARPSSLIPDIGLTAIPPLRDALADLGEPNPEPGYREEGEGVGMML